MNKWSHIHLGLVVLLFSALCGCIDEKTLRPFILPELVNTPNYLVESCPADSTLLIAAEGGVLTRYGDLQQYAFTVNNHPELDEIDPTNVEVLYSNVNETFWILSDSLIVSLVRDQITIYEDTTAFYRPTRFYFDYCLSEDGILHRVDYYDELWDPQSGSFLSDYYLSVHRFEPGARSLWQTEETDLTIRSDQLSTPSALFSGDALLILTNPSYRVTGLFTEGVSTEVLSRESTYDGLVDPVINQEDVVYGLPSEPGFFVPFNVLLELPLTATNTQRLNLANACVPDRNVIGPVKVLQWTDDQVVLFVQYFTNELTAANDLVGYTYTYGVKDASCEINTIPSDDVLIPFSNGIRDVALLNDQLFVGTESGLLVYDFSTASWMPYLKNLFEAETR